MSQGIDIGRALTMAEIDLIRARGYDFALRYLDRLTTSEIATMLSRSLAIGLCYEITGKAALSYDAGKVAGASARMLALQLGAPLGVPILDADATDQDIDPSQPGWLDRCNGFFDGLDGAYVAGVYGSYRVCKFTRENFPGFGRVWQTLAWSGGQVYTPGDAYQFANGIDFGGGLVVDLDFAADVPPWRLA